MVTQANNAPESQERWSGSQWGESHLDPFRQRLPNHRESRRGEPSMRRKSSQGAPLQLSILPGAVRKQVGWEFNEFEEFEAPCVGTQTKLMFMFMFMAKQKQNPQINKGTTKTTTTKIPSAFTILFLPVVPVWHTGCSVDLSYHTSLLTDPFYMQSSVPLIIIPCNSQPHPWACHSEAIHALDAHTQIFETCMGPTHSDWFIAGGWKKHSITCYDIDAIQICQDPSSFLQAWSIYRRHSRIRVKQQDFSGKMFDWAGAWRIQKNSLSNLLWMATGVSFLCAWEHIQMLMG